MLFTIPENRNIWDALRLPNEQPSHVPSVSISGMKMKQVKKETEIAEDIN